MPYTEYNNNGSIQISNDVIYNIAKKATLDVDGVHSISSNFTEDIVEKIGKKIFSKEPSVLVQDKNVKININIIAKSNYKVYDVAKKVQSKVKADIELMTNLNVSNVNVNISGIEFNKNTTKDN